MEEKDLNQEAEIIIEQDDEYDDLLKKFEEPTEYKKPKKKHSILGFVLSLTGVVLLASVVLLMLFIPNENDSQITDDSALISVQADDDNIWQAQAETTAKGKIKQNGTGNLVEYFPADISNITVENSYGTYGVDSYTPEEKTGETDPETGEETSSTSTTEYTLVGFEDFELESGAADDLANDCASLTFTQIIEADATDNLSDYGLDNPRGVATVTYTDGKNAVIKVGNDALQGAGTYVSFGTSNAVYLVATDAVDTILKGMNELISLTINSSAEDTENADFEYVQLTGKAYGEKIVLELNDDTASITNSHIITYPEEVFADDTEASAVSGGIRGLMASSVVCLNPTAKDLKNYGLSDNYAHLVAKYSDITVNLHASKPDSEGSCYLIKNGGNVVYQIDSTSIGWVSTNLENLTSDYVLCPNMQGLSAMTVTADNPTTFMLSSETTQTTDEEGNTTDTVTTTVYCGATELTSEYFESYFDNISLLTKCDTSKKNASGKADLTITYSYSGSRAEDTVKFYKDSNNRHLVTVNGKSVGYVYSSYITKIIEQTTKVSKDKQVASFW